MTGNDIVDLKTAQLPGGLKRSRFLDKIFSAEEQDLINIERAGVWPLWAMKEAVYKAHHRKFNLSRSFDPKGIKINIWEDSKNSIIARAKYLDHDYLGRGILTSDYVHVTATGFPQEQIYSEIHNSTGTHITSQFKKAISKKLNLEVIDLAIVKDKNLIPHLYYRKSNLNIPFSISHHGNYAAFSYQLINY